MDIIVSNTSPLPLYQQIKKQIRAAIAAGDLKEGDPLPSIRALANHTGVSVLTIRRVYDDLETEGFVVSKAGRGTFVGACSDDVIKEMRRREVEERLTSVIDAAKELGVTRDELHAIIDILYEGGS